MYFQEFNFFDSPPQEVTKRYLCNVMKTFAQKFILSLICLVFCLTTCIKAQDILTLITIKTSAVCEICKKNIQNALKFKGVEKSDVDLKTQLVTVTYDPQQTSPEKIKQAISKAGYNADELKANPKAYKKLDKCCKKENIHP
jgi:mercuric ion binding protein